MKRFLLLTPLLCVTSIHAADPPAKRSGGFFGFGAQKSEQISADLFPSSGREKAATPNAGPAGDGGEIFRSGKPRAVDAVSYVIQNGRKIERPIETAAPALSAPVVPVAETVSAPVAEAIAPADGSGIELASDEGRKKGGFFAFGRRGADVGENEVVTPVPAAGGVAPPRATPAPAPVPIVAAPTAPAIPAAPAATPIVETADTPNFAGVKKEKEEKFGWIPFLSRKKQNAATEREANAPAPAVIAAQPIPSTPVAATPAKPAAAKPAATTASTTTFEVPRDDSKKEEKKEVKPGSSGGGILSPIANIRPPRKELDLSSAETIIQNGEIVGESETNFKTVSSPTSTGQSEAPRIVNGVKTYSSWDDVNARSSSAADKIIGSMR